MHKLRSCESDIIQNISGGKKNVSILHTHTELYLVTQVLGTLSLTAPGCPDMDLSKNSVEEKKAFTKGTTSQEVPMRKLISNQYNLAPLQK